MPQPNCPRLRGLNATSCGAGCDATGPCEILWHLPPQRTHATCQHCQPHRRAMASALPPPRGLLPGMAPTLTRAGNRLPPRPPPTLRRRVYLHWVLREQLLVVCVRPNAAEHTHVSRLGQREPAERGGHTEG